MAKLVCSVWKWRPRESLTRLHALSGGAGTPIQVFGGSVLHPFEPVRCSGLLLVPVFLFPVASELFNHMSVPPIGCGLSFGTQINAC